VARTSRNRAPRSLLLDVSGLDRPGRDRGIGRYIRQLQSTVHNLSTIRVTEYMGRNGSVGPRWAEWAELPHRAITVHRHGGLYHAASVYHLVPSALQRSIVSVLDIIPLELPQYRQTGFKARTFFPQARWCRGVVVLSQHTAQRVHSVLGVPEERIVVCPLPIIVPEKQPYPVDCCRIGDLPDVFVSSVIDVVADDPRKRVPWLLSAAIGLQEPGVPLVLIGSGTNSIHAENVIGLGRVCDAHLLDILGRSNCFLYTSAYEGQGLPPQESLAMGTPVVALRNSSLPEMLGPGALWVEEPVDGSLDQSTVVEDREHRVEQLVAEVLRLVCDPILRDAIGQAGRDFVGSFTAKRFQDTMSGFYDRMFDA